MYVEGLYEIPEVRSVLPGHLVRCGRTSAYDVNFGIEAGAAAVALLLRGIDGVTVAGVQGDEIRYMRTAAAIKQRHVDLAQVALHESLGACFGRPMARVDFKFVELTSPPERHI
jgi:6-phosphofructokinase 1